MLLVRRSSRKRFFIESLTTFDWGEMLEKKGPGKSSKDNPLTSWGGWDSKKIQKGSFAIGGYDIAANPNKYDKKKLDALKKLSDPNYSF